MSTITHISAGAEIFEQYGAGGWRPATARRSLKLLACPRAAGSVQPLSVSIDDDWAEAAGFSDSFPDSGYTRFPDCDDSYRVAMPGTYLYQPGASVAGEVHRGRLWRVAHIFDPIAISTEAGELPTVHLQTVLRFRDSAKETSLGGTYTMHITRRNPWHTIRRVFGLWITSCTRFPERCAWRGLRMIRMSAMLSASRS